MPRLRLFLFWLLCLAVPLQGFAASTLLFCAPHAGISAHHAHGDEAATPAGHVHAGHASQAKDGVATDACGACAACCHGPAASASQETAASAPSPAAWQPPPLVRIASRVARVPEKPPRA